MALLCSQSPGPKSLKSLNHPVMSSAVLHTSVLTLAARESVKAVSNFLTSAEQEGGWAGKLLDGAELCSICDPECMHRGDG